jgi:hypothetical protein
MPGLYVGANLSCPSEEGQEMRHIYKPTSDVGTSLTCPFAHERMKCVPVVPSKTQRKTQKATSNFQKKFVVFSPLSVLECCESGEGARGARAAFDFAFWTK